MMKKLIILFAAIILMTSHTISVRAQTSSVSLTGSATCIAVLTITNLDDLNFGNIQAGSTAGTVILSTTGTRSKSGGVTLPAVSGIVTSASFNVTGLPCSIYSITIPTTNYVISNGSSNMIINTFTRSPSGTGTLSTQGTQTIKVGAKLNVGANQAGGIYTNDTGFSVTVIYN